MKVAIITVILEPASGNMEDPDLEAAMKLYLKPEDIPFCQKIDHIKVLSIRR